MSNKYDIEHLPNNYLSSPVHLVRVVAHTMGPVAPGAQLSQNHWTMYLVIQGGSIRLDMTLRNPNSNDETGVLKVSYFEYDLSRSATAYWDFLAAQNATVEQFTNNIVTNRRQNYRMADNGVGCRYWV